jgi:hypothetical protein
MQVGWPAMAPPWRRPALQSHAPVRTLPINLMLCNEAEERLDTHQSKCGVGYQTIINIA